MRKLLLLLLVGCIVACANRSNPSYDLVQINTPMGAILIRLHDETPIHKASFIKLVESNYFDSLTFNRVIDNFVAQGGCPDTPAGFGDSPYLLNPEFRQNLTHIYGAVGAGRDDNPNMLSAGCQFYIVQNKDGLHRLDNKYTVFGQVIKGMDIVDAIVKVETDSIDEPTVPISLRLEYFRQDSLSLANQLGNH